MSLLKRVQSKKNDQVSRVIFIKEITTNRFLELVQKINREVTMIEKELECYKQSDKEKSEMQVVDEVFWSRH